MHLIAQIAPPTGRPCFVGSLEIIRFQHLYPDQDNLIAGLLADILMYQTVYLLGIGYDKGFAAHMKEEPLPLPEEFQPHRELPVEFMDGLPWTGNKEPYLSDLIYFNDRNDGGGNPQYRSIETEKKGIFQILYFCLQKMQIRLGQHK